MQVSIYKGKIMARRTKEDAEKTREDILINALELFCEKGYSKTTFDDIAKRIELTKGAVYWHFRNKQDLLIDLIKMMVMKTHEQENYSDETILKETQTPFASLQELKKHFINEATLIKNNEYYRKFLFFVIYQMEWSEIMYAKVSRALSAIVNYPVKKIYSTLEYLQKKGQVTSDADISSATTMFFCMWKGIVNNYIVNVNEINLQEIVNTSFDMIIRGLNLEDLKEERS